MYQLLYEFIATFNAHVSELFDGMWTHRADLTVWDDSLNSCLTVEENWESAEQQTKTFNTNLTFYLVKV